MASGDNKKMSLNEEEECLRETLRALKLDSRKLDKKIAKFVEDGERFTPLINI
jgi:hypothetical protein